MTGNLNAALLFFNVADDGDKVDGGEDRGANQGILAIYRNNELKADFIEKRYESYVRRYKNYIPSWIHSAHCSAA